MTAEELKQIMREEMRQVAREALAAAPPAVPPEKPGGFDWFNKRAAFAIMLCSTVGPWVGATVAKWQQIANDSSQYRDLATEVHGLSKQTGEFVTKSYLEEDNKQACRYILDQVDRRLDKVVGYHANGQQYISNADVCRDR